MLFTCSLKKDGILFLGSSESAGDFASKLDPINSSHRLFRNIARRSVANASFMKATYGAKSPSVAMGQGTIQQTPRLLERFFNTIADEFLPCTILVNDRMEVLHILGDPGDYLRVPAGAPVNDITKTARPELRMPLSTGIQRALRGAETLKFLGISLDGEPSKKRIDVRIRPMLSRNKQENYVVVMIQPYESSLTAMSSPADVNVKITESHENQVADLEQELQYTRESLQATIEEMETSNEELQATNEELLSSNEELQSTNEELQSTNEELHTVNSEYHGKLQELAEANADIDNLLTTMSTGVLILDENMHIRRFSPMMYEVFGVLPSDIGRPISHLAHHLVDCDPVDLAKQVATNGKSIERQVRTEQEKVFILRLSPFEIGSQSVSTGGVVLTFIDITSRHSLERQLDSASTRSRTFLRYMEQAVCCSRGATGAIEFCNKQAAHLLNMGESAVIGKQFPDFLHAVVDVDGNVVTPADLPMEHARVTGTEVLDFVLGFTHCETGDQHWVTISCLPLSQVANGKYDVLSIWRAHQPG